MPVVIYLLLVLISLAITYVHTEIEFFQKVLDLKIIDDDNIIKELRKQITVNEGAIKHHKDRIEALEKTVNELIRCEKERENANESV